MESEHQQGCRPCSGTAAAEAAQRASAPGQFSLTVPLQPGSLCQGPKLLPTASLFPGDGVGLSRHG